jgi:TIR domain
MHDNEEGAWIFVSHSLKDWNKVRNIRNILEEKGHKPLLFFLKCLNDDSEIDDLIKREIEARNWFILCESENTKKSKWVNAEIEFIKGLEGKVYEIIDLEKDIDYQNVLQYFYHTAVLTVR